MRRPIILASLLMVSLTLIACGGGDDEGDDGSAAPKGPTKQQNVAAIEQVLLAYGAAVGGDVCTYYAESQIEATGGVEECRSANEETSSAIFKVENVAVNGDEATAVVTVKGQEDEVSSYELSREAGDWKISDFPSDDGSGGGGSDETETAPAESGGSDRAEVEELLTAFGEASGSEVCDFFSEGLIEERGGLQACQGYFEGRPALRSEIVKLSLRIPGRYQDVVPSATAVIKSGISGANLYIGLNRLSDAFAPYGGWEITRQGDG